MWMQYVQNSVLKKDFMQLRTIDLWLLINLPESNDYVLYSTYVILKLELVDPLAQMGRGREDRN